MINKLKNGRLLVLFIVAISGYTYALPEECDLFSEYLEYRTMLELFPPLRLVNSFLDVEAYESFVEEVFIDDKWYHFFRDTEDFASVATEALIFRKIWLDSRVRKVLVHKSLCEDDYGEFIFRGETTVGETFSHLIRFRKVNNEWLVSVPHITTSSSILGVSIDEVLESANSSGFDFDLGEIVCRVDGCE